MVTSHYVGNDFKGREFFTVADFNNTWIENVEEYIGHEPQTLQAWEDKGWTNIEVVETGLKFNRKYLIKGQRVQHQSHEFSSFAAAKKFDRKLNRK